MILTVKVVKAFTIAFNSSLFFRSKCSNQYQVEHLFCVIINTNYSLFFKVNIKKFNDDENSKLQLFKFELYVLKTKLIKI